MRDIRSAVVLAAAWLTAGLASAQGLEEGKPASSPEAKAPPIARRIMLVVATPAETLSAQMQGAYVQAPAGSGAAGALGAVIGLLIVKSISESKDRPERDFAIGLRQAVAGIDLQRALAQALQKELERSAYLKGAALEEVRDPSDLERPGLLVAIQEPEIYTLDARSRFEQGFASMHVLTEVRMWRKDQVDPLYSTQLRYASKSLEGGQDKKDTWIADGGALLRRTLSEAMVETARMFVDDVARRTGAAPEKTESTASENEKSGR